MGALGSFFCFSCSKTKSKTPDKKPKPVEEGSGAFSPLDTGVTSNSRQRFVHLLSYRLNLNIARDEEKWALWAEGSSNYELADGRKAFLMSFRRSIGSLRQEGLMVMGRMEGEMPMVLSQWKLPASIDDMHIVSFGGSAGSLIHTVSMGPVGEFRMLHHHLLQLKKHRFSSTWSVMAGYFISEPKRYEPPVIMFSDIDKDGVKEVLVRLPGTGGRKRKRRWAAFKWSEYAGRFQPLRHLGWTPLALQDPVWSLFGFLEAMENKDTEAASRFVLNGRPPCKHPDELSFVFDPNRWTPSGIPSMIHDARTASRPDIVLLKQPLRDSKGVARYEAHVELHKKTAPLPEWKICRATFLKH